MPVDANMLSSLQWRLVGPHRGGRCVAVHGDPKDPMTFYFGACAGGVWKSNDGGTYWENVSDGFFNVSAVGALAVSTSDPNVIYVGTGETTIRGNVSHGDGVYKSTDAGKTWTNVGLKDTRHIASIQIHPTNSDIVYVGALGHAWGPNRERGVYRSTDGGKSWSQILFRSEQAGAADLSMDPNNPRHLYVSFWEAQRFPYKLKSGGPDSSLYKSTDGGDTWTEITRNPGLPKGVLGKMGIVASPAQSGRVYAIVESDDGAFFRSDDGGANWKRLSEDGGLRGRPWYYMHVFADPVDPDTAYVLDYSMWKTIDGGATFSEMPTPHGDNHDLWIDPHNPKRMIQGNDGGATVTFNGGDSWSTIFNQPTAQLYHVIADNQYPYKVYASQQDNTAIALPSASTRGVILPTDWFEPGGGESGYIGVKPTDPNIVIAGAIGSGAGTGRLIRYNHVTGQEQIVSVWPETYGMAIGAVEHKYRFQWTFPIFWSRWDPNMVYISGNRIFRSATEGMNWELASPDLTRNDPDKLQPSGGPITKDNTGAETYCTIFALAESNFEQDVMWAGSDDGLIHITRDGLKTWQNVTPKELPEWAMISVLEPSPHDKASCYVAATRYKSDDLKPYLFKTNDYGQTWKQITTGIPDHEFTRTIRSDPGRAGLLYAGTETGVYVSFDDGANWQRFNSNLPIAPIHDLHVKDTDLVASTHGRSLWILDDLTPLHQMHDALNASAYLFKPRETVRLKINKGYGSKPYKAISYRMAGPVVYAYKTQELSTGEQKEHPLDAGENPPDGVMVHYYLKEAPKDDIKLRFLDANGNLIKEYSSKPEDKPAEGQDAPAEEERPAEEPKPGEEKKESHLDKTAGAHRFVWNMRYPDATKIPGNKGRGGTEELVAGPVASPGTYEVQLVVGGQTQSQKFDLVKDPRVTATAEDFAKQFELAMQINKKVSATHEAIIKIRSVRDQADAWAARAGDKEVKASAAALSKKLTAIESELIQVKSEDPRSFPSKLNSRLAVVSQFVESADSAPPEQFYELVADLGTRIDVQLKKLELLIATDVAAFNEQARGTRLDAIVLESSTEQSGEAGGMPAMKSRDGVQQGSMAELQS